MYRSLPERRRLAVAATFVLLFGYATLGSFGYAAASSADRLELLGVLPNPKSASIVKPILVDPLNRRLYARVDFIPFKPPRVYEYDLTDRVPRIRRDGPYPVENTAIAGLSANTIALDALRERAFLLDHRESGSLIRSWDLRTLTVRPETWNLTTLVPNFSALGITYSSKDNRLYAVGTLAGEAAPLVSQAFALPMLPTAVVAIDATSGALAWVRPIPECQHPGVVQPGLGAGIFRSKALSALYIPCIRPEPGGLGGVAYPGQSALIRLWIAPNAGPAEAVAFRREVFPISGVYANGGGTAGMTVFDEAADRVYLLNQSAGTSGAWVFDGILSAWVGFVPAGDDTNWQIGVDQGSGHMYMRYAQGPFGRNGTDERRNPILITDGRAAPVPQGETFEVGIARGTDWILTDPVTQRVFVKTQKVPADAPPKVLVYKDRTPSAEPDRPVDYDDLTTDVAESARTFATFQGSVNGFGARVALIGGYSGAISPLYATTNGPVLIPGLKPSPRSIVLGRAASLDLSSVGAAASAQAVAPDDVTDDEYETYRKELAAQAGEQDSETFGQLVWPWPAAVCVDAEEKVAEEHKEAAIGRSTVLCDLKTARVAASTRSGGVVLESVSVDGGSFVSNVSRTAHDGTVVEATATARGVEISLPGVGRLAIGRISSTVRTAAHGRPGTAAVRWVRDIDGVLLTDASGEALFRCPEACSPEAVANAVNENIGSRIRVVVPDAERAATPRGAFAGIRETKALYFDGLVVNDDDSRAVPALEVLVINDTAEKSRLDIQLAAIEASSIYGISLLPEEGGLSTPPLVDVPAIPPVTGLGPPPDLGPAPLGNGVRSPALATTRSSVLAVRSAADALFLSLICLLVIATVAGGIRRHRFAALLNGGPQQ